MRHPADADRGSGRGNSSANSPRPLTLVATGLRARLVPRDPERVRRLQDLIASCESLRIEWEHLCERLVAALEEETQGAPPPEDPSSGSARD